MHISRPNLRLLAVLATAAFVMAAVVVAPVSSAPRGQAAAAKKHKIKVVFTKGTFTGDKVTGEGKDKTLGTCKMKGTAKIPVTYQTWKCKGGTFKITSRATSGAANDAKGTWKVDKGKGTGRYKGITGGGKWSGKISTLNFTYAGTVKY